MQSSNDDPGRTKIPRPRSTGQILHENPSAIKRPRHQYQHHQTFEQSGAYAHQTPSYYQSFPLPYGYHHNPNPMHVYSSWDQQRNQAYSVPSALPFPYYHRGSQPMIYRSQSPVFDMIAPAQQTGPNRIEEHSSQTTQIYMPHERHIQRENDERKTANDTGGRDSNKDEGVHQNKENDGDVEGKPVDFEEPKATANKNSPTMIPGTSIVLQTEEEVAKWREERRKMWLLKISNNRDRHQQDMGVQIEDITSRDAFKQVKKDKQFIQNIQAQVTRINPRANLDLKIRQRTMAEENMKLLQFIQELGDANLLEYELSQDEKEKLFGNSQRSRSRNEPRNSNSRMPNRGLEQ
ncbi:LAMI_0D08702g1_1 [Lachancea mirantina]|uniref:LAMI_0D08702g1_1 n=1 Tax=Lachancea mirantina TaxID=1230905 RepID=A0A1G4JDU3_9SACH|nr:LAMI_0D08702g1_1 [Lachancea mirantina]